MKTEKNALSRFVSFGMDVRSRSPISLMCLLKATPRWIEKKEDRGRGIRSEFIQSILVAQEQHSVVQEGEKRQDVVEQD